MTTFEEPAGSNSAPDATAEEPVAQVPAKRKVPAFFIVLGVGILFLGGLLAVMLIKPPQKSLCDEVAPDWTLTLFPEYKGGVQSDTVSLADLKGKGVVLNFWASWCGPCEQEAAELEAAWQKYKDKGIVFIGVDYLDQDPAAKRYLREIRNHLSERAGPRQQGLEALHNPWRARNVLHRSAGQARRLPPDRPIHRRRQPRSADRGDHALMRTDSLPQRHEVTKADLSEGHFARPCVLVASW